MSGFAINEVGGYRSVDSVEDICEGETFSGCLPNTPKPIKKTLEEEVGIERLLAYSHPITGSDRLRTEAEAEKLSGNLDKAKALEVRWLERRTEISKQYPWPKDIK